MVEGMILMGCPVLMIVMDYYRERRESKWTYFIMGMLFSLGMADFVKAFAHWMN
jgi:hypothetical protein